MIQNGIRSACVCGLQKTNLYIVPREITCQTKLPFKIRRAQQLSISQPIEACFGRTPSTNRIRAVQSFHQTVYSYAYVTHTRHHTHFLLNFKKQCRHLVSNSRPLGLRKTTLTNQNNLMFGCFYFFFYFLLLQFAARPAHC